MEKVDHQKDRSCVLLSFLSHVLLLSTTFQERIVLNDDEL